MFTFYYYGEIVQLYHVRNNYYVVSLHYWIARYNFDYNYSKHTYTNIMMDLLNLYYVQF